MKRLIAVEIRRMVARRAVRVAGLVAILTVVTTGVLATTLSDPNVSAARELRRVQRAEEIRACLAGETDIILETKGAPVDLEEYCDTAYSPDRAAAELDPRVRLDALGEIYLGVAGPLAVLAVIVGATFIGAEWSSRSMTGTLMWEPRRLRLILAKATASAVVVAAGTAVFLLALGAAIAFAAALRGTTAGANAAWLGHVSALGLRVAAVTGLASIAGVALATAFRSAAASIGVLFVLLAPVEGAVRGLRPGWRPWLMGDNAGLFVTGTSVADLPGRTPAEAGLVVLVYVAVLLAVATALFERRDIA